jgi:hypothetical protein
MWAKYRRWKPVVTLFLAGVAWQLLKYSLPESSESMVGLAIAAGLALAYLVEEAIWMSKGNTRPCSQCGRPIPVKAFRMAAKCPHCGALFGLE